MKSVVQDRLDRNTESCDTRPAAKQVNVERVLILTSSLGAGHLRGGQAVEAALQARYPQIRVESIDFWSLMDGSVADAAKQSYLDLVQDASETYQRIFELDGIGIQTVMHRQAQLDPEVAEGFSKLAERSLSADYSDPRAIRSAFDRGLYRLLRWGFPGKHQDSHVAVLARRLAIVIGSWRMARRLRQAIEQFQPQSIVVTQPLPAGLLALIKRRAPLDIPVVGVLTNWGVIGFYAQSAIDYYCVPHDSIPGLSQLEPLSVTGCPLMPGFRNPPSRAESRARLGLDPDLPVVMVQGGGLGIHIVELARTLLKGTQRVQILVQAGSNKRAIATLQSLACEHGGRLHVGEWTDEMYLSLRAADVVVGKPGGLTLAECLACGRPLLATGSTGGQETLNVEFLERHGVGWEINEDRVVDAVQALLEDPDELNRIEHRAFGMGERLGAEKVADLVATHDFSELAKRI